MKETFRKKKYINNADLLSEIQKSKISYCWVLDKAYAMYDYIVFDESEITAELLEKAHKARVKRLNKDIIEKIKNENNCGPKRAQKIAHEQNLLIVDPETVPMDEVVIRVITDEHIPYTNEQENEKVRTNFEPFKQYIVDDSGELYEVVRSHWEGDIEDGQFSIRGGSITNDLGKMFIKLAEEISHRSNYRKYTYIDEMRGEARDTLVKNALLFKESLLYRKENPTAQLNPFAYYTSFVNNAFKSVLNSEKRMRDIRDDLLEMHGFNPSHTRQNEIEAKMIEERKSQNGTV